MKRQLDLLTTDQDIGKDRIEELITQLSALLEQKNP
jgi:hypothetical protein